MALGFLGMRRFLTALVFVCFWASLAQAGEDPSDPWLLADGFEAAGDHEAALRLAASPDDPAVERLGAYLARRAARAELPALRARLAAALQSCSEEKPQAALETLADVAPEAASVPAVRVHLCRGAAHEALRQAGQAAESYRAAADLAETLGWWTQASEALYLSARIHDRLRQYGEAVRLYGRHLALEERLQSKIGRGRAHFRLANVLLEMPPSEAQGDAGMEHLRQAAALATEAEDHEYLASVLSTQARRLVATGTPAAEALPKACQAAAEIRKTDPSALPPRFRPDPQRLAESEAAIHMVCMSLAARLPDQAKAVADHARAAVEAAGRGGDERLKRRTRAVLGVIEGKAATLAGRQAEALEKFRQARADYGPGASPYRLADLGTRIALSRAALGDLPGAYVGLEEVFGILDQTPQPDPNVLFMTHLQAGDICTRLGRGREGLEHLRQALALAEGRKTRNFAVDRANALVALAHCQAARAQLAEALDSAREALELLEEAQPSAVRGRARLAMGQIHRQMGALEAAESEVRAAVQDLAAVGETSSLRVANSEYARLLQRLGDTDKALELSTRLLEEQGYLQDPRGLAWAHLGVARLQQDAGAYPSAAKHWREAVALFETLGDERAEVSARAQYGLALVYADQPRAGLKEIQRAVAGAEHLDYPWGRAACVLALTHAYALQGEDEKCMLEAAKGIQLIAELGMDLAEGEGAVAREGFAELSTLGAQAALRLGRTEVLFRFLEQGRAATFFASLAGRSALREAVADPTLEAAVERARKQVAEAMELYAAARQDRGAESFRRARELRAQFDAAQEALADAIRDVRRDIRRAARAKTAPGDSERASLQAVSEDLKPDQVLVLYAVVAKQVTALVIRRPRAPADTVPGTPADRPGEAPSAAAFARSYDLGPWATVQAELERLPLDTAGREAQPGAAALGALLIEPLQLGPVERLLLSTGPELSYVPFSLLLQDKQLVLIPSATSLQVLRAQEPAAGAKLLAIGNPAYRNSARALPKSQAEVEAIVHKERGDEQLTGKEATKEALQAMAASGIRWRAVHFACHGHADRDKPMLSRLELSDLQGTGTLSALEVFDLRLQADLVVLSGCETGVGRVVQGEGILGLTRAFLQSGASRVIASLWDVDDAATSELMQKFYELWRPPGKDPGLPAPEALQRAQAHIRSQEKWKHPHYWAAWVLWGLPE